MASTSCSSSNQNWKNDVFLSFRGKDTRKTFVGHLYYALKQKGIHTFKDDGSLERGKSISPELVKAIEQSRFAIVVLSKNYASSTWCLDELVKIMECKKELGQTVIPIFYDVDPSHVTKQSGSFAKSFATHEENLKDDLEKVLCWRDAFRQAGKIAGYDLPTAYDGYESNCIQDVVEEILSKLCQVNSTIENDLVGMESRVHEVSSLLRMETPDVRFIGLWGMGGIGKTTIASAVFGKYSGQFEGVCFLDNVAEMQRTRGLQYLQNVLLSKILKVNLTIASVYEGMRIIKERLRSMKVLIILDDVNQKDQLEMLVGGHDWFGAGSRILITTTDKHLLHHHEVDGVYSVNLMTLNEAIELFSLHAFKQRIPDKDFEELLNQVVQNAGFLPLALKVIGSSLYGLDKSEWKCTVDRLMDMPDHVLDKLKISFEGLRSSDQRLFLDIGCFYRGKLRSYVEEMLESCDIGSTIRVLINKSLLFVSPYDTIEMHDLIQEMAWHIVRQGDTRRSRIWLPEDIEDLFTGNLDAEAVEGLCIPWNYTPKQDISYYNINEAFRRMKRLRVLVVRATHFCSIDPITHLPSSIRWLDWEGFPLTSLPQSFEPSKLLRLDILESTTLQRLWSISKGLDKLKTLYLSYCDHLEEVPSFDMMPNLERVKLEGCKSLREISPSFGVLMKLTSMELIDCLSLEKLPSCIEMGSLKSLKLSCLPKLRELPEIKGMHRLLTLELTNCQNLEKLPSFDQMESLETLKLSCLPKVTTVPPPDGMHCLQDIVIEYVPIVELPASIGNLRSLKQLRLSHCKDLASIPNSFCRLKNLRVLLIYNCKRLVYLPEKIGDLKLLKKLVVSGTSISQIPPSVADLGELSFLSFSHWSGYRQGATFLFPPALGKSSSLRVLKLNKNRLCGGEHFQDLGGLSSLAHLDLTRNDESTNQLFHYLDITFCEKLALPQLPQCIKELYASDPLILKSIPDFLTKYSELYSVSFTRHIENRGELTDILLFVLRAISVASQCEKRLPFSLCFPGDIRWKGFTYYRKEQTNKFSTQLDPCWYESKFKGVVICFRVPSVIVQNQKLLHAKAQRGCSHRFGCTKVTAKLVQRYNRQEHDVLKKKCLIVARQTFCSHGSKYAICFCYIPFVAPLWHHTSDSDKGKKLLNDYCFFEASIEPDIATKWGLLLVYENKIQQIDQSTITVQHDVESRNSSLFTECNDGLGQKMEDASVKRRRLDSCSSSIIPDRQLETPSSSADQSFQHGEESCQTIQLPRADW